MVSLVTRKENSDIIKLLIFYVTREKVWKEIRISTKRFYNSYWYFLFKIFNKYQNSITLSLQLMHTERFLYGNRQFHHYHKLSLQNQLQRDLAYDKTHYLRVFKATTSKCVANVTIRENNYITKHPTFHSTRKQNIWKEIPNNTRKRDNI